MEAARDLCAYVEASPSPFHAVAESVRRLEAAGFSALRETGAWSLRPGAAQLRQQLNLCDTLDGCLAIIDAGEARIRRGLPAVEGAEAAE